MTDKQMEVMNMLIQLYKEKGEPIGPTEIGLAMGKDYQSASSYCSKALKKAVVKGLAKKNAKGRYVPFIN